MLPSRSDQFVLRTLTRANDSDPNPADPTASPEDYGRQFVISLLLAFAAVTGFCLVRPRWPNLYYSRMERNEIRRRNEGLLPELPRTMFGWVVPLFQISEAQVLASAGLDAFVFLNFFKLAISFLCVASLLNATVLTPIHFVYNKDTWNSLFGSNLTYWDAYPLYSVEKEKEDEPIKLRPDKPYLWVYVVFVYLFTALAFFFLHRFTTKIIAVRQSYLGNQSTVTDRTIKLSGIPENLRSDGQLREYLKILGIGKVKNICLCRDWSDLDRLVAERKNILRKLEEVVTVLGRGPIPRNQGSLPVVQPEPAPETNIMDDGNGEEEERGEGRPLLHDLLKRTRPRLKIPMGWLGFRFKSVDAISYYEAKLNALDDRITGARRKEYKPTPIAFVTFESVPGAQIAAQTLLDPVPGKMKARAAPAPKDVNWSNTYLSRQNRLFRGWGISIAVSLFSIIWLIPVGGLAALLNLEQIQRYLPRLAEVLEKYEWLRYLVQKFLPILVLTLLNVAVPYFYEYLSQVQGYLSHAEEELSVISKNFFFTFFNLFLVFTVGGTAFNFSTLWDNLKDTVGSSSALAYAIAASLERLAPFYVNLIMFQGIGMFPVRLLNLGSLLLYPISLLGAKTERDRDEIMEPPIFRYGFYLPQPVLVFMLCMIYSILPSGVLILIFGLVYFIFGFYAYKYQLLYAMDHPRHSTGRAWPMIVYRVILGLVVFQLAMAGYLGLRQAYTRAGLILPALLFTMWTFWYYNTEYFPRSEYIALRAIRMRIEDPAREFGVEHTVDEERESEEVYMNPSMMEALESPRIVHG